MSGYTAASRYFRETHGKNIGFSSLADTRRARQPIIAGSPAASVSIASRTFGSMTGERSQTAWASKTLAGSCFNT